MSSLRYGTEVVEPIAVARTGLKRRASSPELATLNSILDPSKGKNAQPYEVGQIVRLQLRNHILNARITKLFNPFTMAPVMVVQIHAPYVDLRGDFVLKIYDRRYASAVREEEEIPEWDAAHEVQFQKEQWRDPSLKLASDLIKQESHQTYSAEGESATEEIVDAQDRNASSECGWQELELDYTCTRTYIHELETYRRAREHSIDGKDVPRFISTVRVPQTYWSRYCTAPSYATEGIPGILLQYIPGFPLSDLYDVPSPVPEQSTWKHIIDDGARAVANMVQSLGVNNLDTCPRNTVVHWDPIKEEWRCKIIDFGRTVFQSKATSDDEWRRRQAQLDEEASIAQYMEGFLKREKGFWYTYERSQYYQKLMDEFDFGLPSDWDSFHSDDDQPRDQDNVMKLDEFGKEVIHHDKASNEAVGGLNAVQTVKERAA